MRTDCNKISPAHGPTSVPVDISLEGEQTFCFAMIWYVKYHAFGTKYVDQSEFDLNAVANIDHVGCSHGKHHSLLFIKRNQFCLTQTVFSDAKRMKRIAKFF